METIQVKIADYAIIKEQGILVTYGLGSCVGIALYDPGRKVAGLAHILLNDSAKFRRPGVNSFNPAKFADTAIPLLLQDGCPGASKAGITAKIAGGASLFSRQAQAASGKKYYSRALHPAKAGYSPKVGGGGRQLRPHHETAG